ncbi:MAG: hypothetical protein J5787_06015 [Alphaproteobacteria bacterium]|nr:hypothetical protein [Alphaproteobacteria bacterium]
MVIIGDKKNAGPPKKRGRKSAYEQKIRPNLAQIAEWAKERTDEQIARLLDVTPQTFCKYKQEKTELFEALKHGRTALVENLYNTLIKKAQGFQYTESKTIEEADQNGNLTITRKETYTRTALPDVAAIHLLLKNYDRENWSENPQMLELKRQELEIQKQKADAAAW